MKNNSDNFKPIDFGNKIEKNGRNLFKKMKKKISFQGYNDILKSVNLFIYGILDKDDLLLLIEQILEFEEELKFFKKFSELLIEINNPDQNEYQNKTSIMNIENQESSGKSYKALPYSLTNKKCSARTDLEKSVLNDRWISFPRGSEVNSVGENQRSDESSDESSDDIEDEMHRNDVEIELNNRLFREIWSICKNIDSFNNDQLFEFLERLFSDRFHVLALTNIYNKKIEEVKSLLTEDPKQTLLIIYERLKLVDLEVKKNQAQIFQSRQLK
ncbi:sin3a isoform g [Anaeramoeba ignava]|uniref:Sin3a isoform g n=1 Tax=Anaeramoeba ignava TaxID=1746090 RepID=A0A9Q0L8X4_ANAIG|nr:sin3a isoform g [Anaeramoeba ignava]